MVHCPGNTSSPAEAGRQTREGPLPAGTQTPTCGDEVAPGYLSPLALPSECKRKMPAEGLWGDDKERSCHSRVKTLTPPQEYTQAPICWEEQHVLQ